LISSNCHFNRKIDSFLLSKLDSTGTRYDLMVGFYGDCDEKLRFYNARKIIKVIYCYKKLKI
jgi:hypothetical protein